MLMIKVIQMQKTYLEVLSLMVTVTQTSHLSSVGSEELVNAQQRVGEILEIFHEIICSFWKISRETDEKYR